MMWKQAVGWMVVGVLVLLLSIPAQAYAAYEFYVSIEGVKQGRFKGESMRKGMEGKIPGIGFADRKTDAPTRCHHQAVGRFLAADISGPCDERVT
jgi:hypothetical protein